MLINRPIRPVNENLLATIKFTHKKGNLVSLDDDVRIGLWQDCMNAMAAHASELEIAKKNLTDAVGDNVKQ